MSKISKIISFFAIWTWLNMLAAFLEAAIGGLTKTRYLPIGFWGYVIGGIGILFSIPQLIWGWFLKKYFHKPFPWEA